MTDTFVTPGAPTRAGKTRTPFNTAQNSFNLAPLGGMSSQSSAETVYSAWVQMPTPQSALDLALAVTALTGTTPTLAVTVQTCRSVVGGSAVDTPRPATGGLFGSQTATGTFYTQCLVLLWVRLQIVVGGTTPASAFAVTGTGVPLGQS